MEQPTSEGLRYRKKLKTRLAVERAALELVMERGYDNVTVEDICTRTEISKKTFFNYFSSKAAVIVGKTAAFPNDEQLVEILEERIDTCYVDTLVDMVGASLSIGVDKEIASLRREALRAMPQLFFQGQRDILEIQSSISAALRTHLAAHPECRMLPYRPIEHEAIVSSSTIIGIARMRSMLTVCDGQEPTAADTRRLMIAYLSADESCA